jgi:hypothetical protein
LVSESFWKSAVANRGLKPTAAIMKCAAIAGCVFIAGLKRAGSLLESDNFMDLRMRTIFILLLAVCLAGTALAAQIADVFCHDHESQPCHQWTVWAQRRALWDRPGADGP